MAALAPSRRLFTATACFYAVTGAWTSSATQPPLVPTSPGWNPRRWPKRPSCRSPRSPPPLPAAPRHRRRRLLTPSRFRLRLRPSSRPPESKFEQHWSGRMATTERTRWHGCWRLPPAAQPHIRASGGSTSSTPGPGSRSELLSPDTAPVWVRNICRQGNLRCSYNRSGPAGIVEGMRRTQSAQNSQRDAEFDEYVAGRSRRLLGVATMLVGRHDAEDALQEALISLYRRWDSVMAADNPDAYVHRSLVNASLQLLRRRRRIELPPAFDPRGLDDAVGDRQHMLQVLASLPPRQRAVLVLAFYEDRNEA